MSKPSDMWHEAVASGRMRPDPAQKAALVVLDALYARVTVRGFARLLWRHRTPDTLQGVYLHGGVGRGKSWLMDLFYRALPADVPARRVHFHAFMLEVHAWLHDRRGARVDTLLPDFAAGMAKKIRVLCFDEFQVQDVADAMILARLFTALFDRGVYVIFTSNIAPEDLYAGGLQRDRFVPFIALLRTRTQVVHLEGAVDYRTQCLRQEGVYFWPLGANAHARVDAVFARLTAYAEPVPETLAVGDSGRTISVPAATGGIARIGFSEVCERPRAAADYQALADRYHTLILEGVPKLGYDRRNEARRFTILIDTLYERRTRLVLTADAPPEKLWRVQGLPTPEIQRTQSRLLEMQSAEWFE